jgi:N-acetylneuraminate synthase
MNMRNSPVLVIAEAGVNHNGSIDLALQLIDVAAEAGADVVKFQTFKSSELASSRVPKAEYQLATTSAAESQLDMLKRIELSEVDHEKLIAHAVTRGIRLLSTPFDLPSLRLLTQRFGFNLVKVPSGEITNGPFLLEVARTNNDVILSTGMSTLSEVEAALSVLAFGFTQAQGAAVAGERAFEHAFASDAGQSALRAKVTLLHCTTEYPAPVAEVNLLAMDTLAHAFGLPVGFSDHTAGIHIPLAAVARGARVIEKHFTLDRTMPGPDHAASLEPGELKDMVRGIRDVERALGDGVKRPTGAEWKNRPIARKCLVATAPIRKGEMFTPKNLGCKRSGEGLSPMSYWQMLGKPATRDYQADDPLGL